MTTAEKGQSFLGVAFKDKLIAKVRITPGTTAVGPSDDLANKVNIVALDDFIYGEPAARCSCQ